MPASSQPAPIMFRPGPLLSGRLADLSATWRLTENEAAKRLVAIAVYQLNLAEYNLVVQMAEALKTPTSRRQEDFVLACANLRMAIDSANRARHALKEPLLTEVEVRAFLKQTVEVALRRKKVSRTQTQEQVTVKVYRTR